MLNAWTNNRNGYFFSVLCIVFIFPLLWILFLTQNVPFSTMDDPTIHYLAKTTPYSKILSRILNPLTPTWTYQFQALGGEQNSLGLRPVELFIWKSLQNLCGYTPFAFNFLKAVFLALLSTFLFYFIYRLSSSLSLAALAALFYSTTLSAYNSVTVITAFDILAQFFQGLSILLFLHLHEGSFKTKESTGQFLCKTVGLFLLVWLSIKTYETVKVLPAIFLAFLSFQFLFSPKTFLQNAKTVALTIAVFFMFIFVIPVPQSYQVYDVSGEAIKNQTGLVYHWDTLYRFLLQNTRNAWEPEKDIAFFSIKTYLPFSVARTFGFFLCWIGSLAILRLVVRPAAIASLPDRKRFMVHFLVWWTLASVAALGLAKESDGRHLMASLIPLTALAAFSIHSFYTKLKLRWRKAFVVLCFFAWAWAFLTNLNHNIYFRKLIGGLQIAQDKYMTFIYKDIYKTDQCSYEDMTRFMRVPEALCIWHIPFIIDDVYGEFDRKVKPEHLTGIVSKYGHAYIVTTDPTRIPQDKRYVKRAQFDERTPSLFTQTVLNLKKKKSPVYTVYQFVP